MTSQVPQVPPDPAPHPGDECGLRAGGEYGGVVAGHWNASGVCEQVGSHVPGHQGVGGSESEIQREPAGLGA